jgi:hypothetical protein
MEDEGGEGTAAQVHKGIQSLAGSRRDAPAARKHVEEAVTGGVAYLQSLELEIRRCVPCIDGASSFVLEAGLQSDTQVDQRLSGLCVSMVQGAGLGAAEAFRLERNERSARSPQPGD